MRMSLKATNIIAQRESLGEQPIESVAEGDEQVVH